MSQKFNLRFDQMLENSPEDIANEDNGHRYESPGSIRNFGFIWPNGNRSFHQYGYMPDAFFYADGIKNKIKLVVSSSIITISGYKLESLFLELSQQIQRWIVITDPRYATEHEPCVIEVLIEEKER
ncbi:hypothetical protein [Emticicia fontis]